MSSRTFFSAGMLLTFLGASYFIFTFCSTYLKLEQYAGATGVVRSFLTLATGFNLFNLVIAFGLLCLSGMFYYSLKTHKA